MDLLAKVLSRRKLIHPFMSPVELGRWFFYMFRGKMIHQDISKTASLKNEKMGYYLSHYLIGVILAGVYLWLADNINVINKNDLLALVYGLITVILPWFWLLPATGFGFMAAKSSERKLIIRTNLINHTNFGLGLFLWVILFHKLLLNI